MHAAASSILEFGGFRLDTIRRVLLRPDGTPAQLRPRTFDTLAYLVEHRNGVLEKEQIMAAVWPDSIVEENNLAQAISKLRQVLGEKPSEHEFIVTVPGRGYRFVADVKAAQPLAHESFAKVSGTSELPLTGPSRSEETIDAAALVVTAPAGATRSSVGLISFSLLALTVIAAAIIGYLTYFHPVATRQSATTTDKSIAVLPFENLSDDKQNNYFAAAVQDEILTNIAQSPELKVISRMSCNAFPAGQQRNAREIARVLGVAYLLEGSVQRSGERIRVHAQLIDARNDLHIWAQTYDRQLADVFAIQSDIATAIAQQLQARVSPSLPNQAGKLTKDPQAYLFYLRARHAGEFSDWRQIDWRRVISLFDQAIAADPSFALARARLSIFIARIVHDGADETLRARSKLEAEEALRLNPDLGEGHLAMAYWYLYSAHDYERAAAEVARSGQLLPNSAEVPLLTAFLCKAQGRFHDRIIALRRAEELDPANPQPYSSLVLTLRWLREWKQAMQVAEERATFGDHPLVFVSAWARANDEFRLTGDIEVLKKAAADDAQRAPTIPAELVSFENYQVAMFERDFARAKQFLEQIPPAEFTDKLAGVAGHLKETHAAFIAAASNADAITKAEVFSRVDLLIPAASPAAGRIDPSIDASLVHAIAGRKDNAIRELQSVMAQSSRTDSSIEANAKLAALAAIYTQVGEPEKALNLIEHLLTVPSEVQAGFVYNMTLTDLKWSWIWDPLRSNPRFQKLVNSPEPKTVY